MINSNAISDLRQPVQSYAIHFIAAGEMRLSEKFDQRIKIKLTSTLRDVESQDALYAKGRTEPGPKVTNAKGGDSFHNYGLAWDAAVILANGQATWEKQYYEELGAMAKEMGIRWGGDWNGDGVHQRDDFDLVHFQVDGGLTLAQLKAGEEPQIA
jgi:peptidoglycan L-alanyl-D-glutamate endopeptidase CwlK